MKRLIVIADFCNDSLACQELRTKITGYLKDHTCMEISFMLSHSSSINSAFLLNQVVETEEKYGIPRELVIYVEAGFQKEAKTLIVKLANGITIIGPNIEYTFSLVKSRIEALYFYEGLEHGTAQIIAYLMDYLEQDMDLTDNDISIVPEFRGTYVGHLNGRKCIKTTLKQSDFKGKYEYGEEIILKIRGKEQKMKYQEEKPDDIAQYATIYPDISSSHDDAFLEIFTGSASIKEFYPGIEAGDEIALTA